MISLILLNLYNLYLSFKDIKYHSVFHEDLIILAILIYPFFLFEGYFNLPSLYIFIGIFTLFILQLIFLIEVIGYGDLKYLLVISPIFNSTNEFLIFLLITVFFMLFFIKKQFLPMIPIFSISLFLLKIFY